MIRIEKKIESNIMELSTIAQKLHDIERQNIENIFRLNDLLADHKKQNDLVKKIAKNMERMKIEFAEYRNKMRKKMIYTIFALILIYLLTIYVAKKWPPYL